MGIQINSIAIIEDDSKIRQYLAEEIQLHIDVSEIRLFSNAEEALKI